METLQVGDMVYCESDSNSGRRYKVSKVERVTPTQAILKNSVRLKRESKTISSPSGQNCEIWSVVGGSLFYGYERLNDEIVKEYNAQNKRIKISNWFMNFKPTDAEKEQIYNLINPTLQGE